MLFLLFVPTRRHAAEWAEYSAAADVGGARANAKDTGRVKAGPTGPTFVPPPTQAGAPVGPSGLPPEPFWSLLHPYKRLIIMLETSGTSKSLFIVAQAL